MGIAVNVEHRLRGLVVVGGLARVEFDRGVGEGLGRRVQDGSDGRARCHVAGQVRWRHAQQTVVLDVVVGDLLAVQRRLVAGQIHAVLIDQVAFVVQAELAVAGVVDRRRVDIRSAVRALQQPEHAFAVDGQVQCVARVDHRALRHGTSYAQGAGAHAGAGPVGRVDRLCELVGKNILAGLVAHGIGVGDVVAHGVDGGTGVLQSRQGDGVVAHGSSSVMIRVQACSHLRICSMPIWRPSSRSAWVVFRAATRTGVWPSGKTLRPSAVLALQTVV